MEVKCFDYIDLIDFMNELLVEKKSRNSNYSLRAWSRDLGYAYPSSLSQFLKRERSTNNDFIRRFFIKENLSSLEKEYISYLYLKHTAKNLNWLELNLIEEQIKNLVSQG